MKKKGFTLVELLAVIVILAIIALITVPIVLKTISNSEVQAEKQSIYGYARVIEDDKSNFEMTHPGQQYQIKLEEEYDYKGNKVFCQERYFDEKDKLVLNNCYVSDHKLSEEEESKKNHYSYINGKVELIKNNNNSTNTNQGNNENTENNDNNTNNTNNNKIYEIGEEVTVKNEKYNVIGQGNDYVTLLKQQPLTVDEVNTYGGVGTENNHVNRYTSESVGTASDLGDSNHSGTLAYYSSSTCGTVNGSGISYGCTSDYNSSEVKYVVDNWAAAKFTNELKTVDGYSARLAQKEELQPIGWPSCSRAGICREASTTSRWIYNSFSWTMSQYQGFSYIVWYVYASGELSHLDVYAYFGPVRPVINVYKSRI